MRHRILIIILFILAIFVVTKYYKETNPRNMSTFINFEEKLDNLTSLTTKEDIYEKEKRRPNETQKNEQYDLLIYRNKDINGYNGVLMYGFGEDGLLKAISFIFSRSEDYEKFIDEFKSKYSIPYSKENGTDMWEGQTANDIFLFGATQSKSTIDILFLEDILIK